MKDVCLAVGMLPLGSKRIFGTTRWRLSSDYINRR